MKSVIFHGSLKNILLKQLKYIHEGATGIKRMPDYKKYDSFKLV